MKILIAGLARTGTTGLLYLVAGSLGKKAKLLMEPSECPADLESVGGHIVAKILIKPKTNAASFSHFDRKITLVRDPRDRIVSALLYSQYHAAYLFDDDRVRLVRDILERKEASPSSVSIREILGVMRTAASESRKAVTVHRARMRRSLNWLTWFDDYVRAIPDGLLYKYEDFVSEKYRALEEHLGISVRGVAKVPKTVERVARTKSFGDWRHWFTEQDVGDHRPILTPWLEKYGYDAEDWGLAADPFIPPEHCSAYFMWLVEERREGRFDKAAAGRESGSGE